MSDKVSVHAFLHRQVLGNQQATSFSDLLEAARMLNTVDVNYSRKLIP